jgi:hypothetical protein
MLLDEKPDETEPGETDEKGEEPEPQEKPITRKEIEELIEAAKPKHPPKTRAEKVRGEGEEPTKIDETPTCPKCHRPVRPAEYRGRLGYACYQCGRFYLV